MATGPVKIVWLSLIGAIVTAGGVPTCTRLQNAVVNTCPAYFEQCMDDVDIVASLTKFQDRLSCYCDLEKCLMIELEPPPHCQGIQTLIDNVQTELLPHGIFDPTCDGITIQVPTAKSPVVAPLLPPPPPPPPPPPTAERTVDVEMKPSGPEGLDTCSLDEQQAFVDCGLTYQSCLGGSGVELGTGSPQTLEISSYADVSACVCEFSKACLASSQCQALKNKRNSAEETLQLPPGITCGNVESILAANVDLDQFFTALSTAGVSLHLPDFSQVSSAWAAGAAECDGGASTCLQPLQECTRGYTGAPLELETIPVALGGCYCSYLACVEGLPTECQVRVSEIYDLVVQRLAFVAYCPSIKLLGSELPFSSAFGLLAGSLINWHLFVAAAVILMMSAFGQV